MDPVSAEGVKQLFVLLHNSFGLIDFDSSAAVSQPEYPTKHYYVTAREHVQKPVFAEEATTKRHIVNSWIRWQEDKLSLGGHEALIFEQCCGTKAGAIENDRLLERQYLCAFSKGANDILSTGELEICRQLAQQGPGIDLHGHHASRITITKRMLAWIQITLIRK